MKRCLLPLLASLVALTATSCAFTYIRTPYDNDLDQTQLGTKVGTASNYSVAWLVSWGDAGYAAAAKNGNLTVMRHADEEIQQYLFGLYLKRTIIVYGD
jgi:hypothetical protein